MKDLARIYIKAGDGGNGVVHFRREKYAPKGGPDGGDGGKGGDIIFIADENIENLVEFNYNRKFEAKNGGNGGEKKSTGGKADDVEVRVPVGTEVYTMPAEYSEANLRERKNFDELMQIRKFVVDMDTHGKRFIMAYGGDGGRGNDHFKSSMNQTPMEREEGHSGEEKWLILEQKVVADVGIIGLPNVGKSSILKSLTRANPKIAGYPFTTLEPNLGVASVGDKKIVLVDVPGVVEDAYEGKGIGPWFLRHLERTKRLIHVLAPDPSGMIPEGKPGEIVKQMVEQMAKNYKIVRKELEKYGHELTKKEEIVVINKMELVDEKEREKLGKKLEKKIGKKPVWVSAGMGEVEELLNQLS